MEILIVMKTDLQLPSHNVSVNLIMEVVLRCSHGVADIQALESYTGKTGSYLKSAIVSALTLGMIEYNDGTYSTFKECSEFLTAAPTEEMKLFTFRKWLQKWEPFTLFFKYLISGDLPEVSARKITSFFSMNKSPKAISQLFMLWAKSAGIITSEGNIIDIDYKLDEKEIKKNMTDNMLNDVQSRLYLINVLGDDVFNWLKHEEIEELIAALLKYKNDSRSAIECAGRAYEDVLRRISIHEGINVSKLNGITQVSNQLYNNKDAMGKLNNRIHSKHFNISQAIGDIRNMAGHSKEARTMERWELSSTGAFGMILTTIASIRSLYQFIMGRKCSF